MLGSEPIMAFVATTNPERAKEFYGHVLGLRCKDENPFAMVFNAGGTMLRVQKVEELTPAPYTALGWAVKDIRAMVRDLVNRGVKFERYDFLPQPQDADGIWTPGTGGQVAWFKDPDGNTLSLTQFG